MQCFIHISILPSLILNMHKTREAIHLGQLIGLCVEEEIRDIFAFSFFDFNFGDQRFIHFFRGILQAFETEGNILKAGYFSLCLC